MMTHSFDDDNDIMECRACHIRLERKWMGLDDTLCPDCEQKPIKNNLARKRRDLAKAKVDALADAIHVTDPKHATAIKKLHKRAVESWEAKKEAVKLTE
jgi:hypothetical protein